MPDGLAYPNLGETLFQAAAEGDLQQVESLLRARDTEALSWRKPESGWTALHVAVEMGELQVIRALVNAGAPLEARDLAGWTPVLGSLDSAIDGAWQTGSALDLRVATFLLDAGANPSARALDRRTPLVLVRERDCREAEELLTVRGAS
jgi:ankyrin repeat protein